MKVLLVCTPCLPCRTDLEYGGLERVVAFLAEGLTKKHEVTLIAGKGSKAKGVELITPVESRYALPGENREADMWLKAGINAEDYDVIEFHTHRKPAIKKENVCWSVHDFLPQHPIYPYKLIARSRFHAEWLIQRWNYDVTYAYNCINAEEFEFSENKDDYFLFLSRMMKGKGIFNLVKIAKRFPDTTFIMAGEDSIKKGIDLNELNSLFKQLPDNIEYLGSVSDKEKKDLLSRAKALVIPYDNSVYQEVFGLIHLEALASNTPVFTIDNGAVRELLGGIGLTKCGYVAKNIEELIKAMSSFLNGKITFNPEDLKKRPAVFSPEAMIKRYEEIYNTIEKIKYGN